MNTITLDVPAMTYEGLRAQAKVLDVAGRGRMNKAQLTEAVLAQISMRRVEAETAHAVVLAEVHADHGHPATVPARVSVPTPLDMPSRRPERGAGLARTRAGRVDYPAGRTRKRGKKGRK